jgi:hypothetical protein
MSWPVMNHIFGEYRELRPCEADEFLLGVLEEIGRIAGAE